MPTGRDAPTNAHGLEVGIVSTDRRLVDFYAEVFDLDELDPVDYGMGVLYRLSLDGAILKINVPEREPEPRPVIEPFTAAVGLRYLSVAISDLAATVERATSRGARVRYGPMESDDGQPHIVLEDPDGNTVELFQR